MMIADLVKRLITFVKIKNNHLKCGGANYIGLNVKIVNRGQIVFGKNVIIRPSTGLYTNPGIMLSIGSNTEIGNQRFLINIIPIIGNIDVTKAQINNIGIK